MGKYYEKNQEGSTEGTVWNFDNAEAQLIFYYKSKFVTDLNGWQLEDAFWDLKTLYMEGKALLKDTDRTNFEKQYYNPLLESRKNYNSDPNPSDEKKGLYHSILTEVYEELCDHFKAKGLYFREKESYQGL